MLRLEMKRTALSQHPCSIARALDVTGEWWTLLIVRDVAYGVRRFREIQEDLGVSANVLSERLETLVREGILERAVYQERPRREEYHLTEKGAELIPVLLALMQWGDRWAWGRGRGPVRVEHAGCGHGAHVSVRCERCERELEPAELRARLLGGARGAPEEHSPGSVSARQLLSSRNGLRLKV